VEIYLHYSCALWRPQEYIYPCLFRIGYGGRTVAQAVSRRPVTAESRIKSQANLRGIV
jgi:hypothetical protein